MQPRGSALGSPGIRAGSVKRFVFIAAVILVAGTLAFFSYTMAQSANLNTQAGNINAINGPMLLGENIYIDVGNNNNYGGDWFSNAKLRAGLQQLHTTIIRLPVRGPNSPGGSPAAGFANENEFKLALADIKAMGASPLVVLRNVRDPNLLQDDTQAMNDVGAVFHGTSTVIYIEIMNEPDLGGVDAPTEVKGWNTVVPALQALPSLRGLSLKFMGPVLAGYKPLNYAPASNPDFYLDYFLTNAKPQPDVISWHEYTCSPTDPDYRCSDGLSKWSAHIADANQHMRSILGQAKPIIISEWNMDAWGTRDPRTGTQFETDWTTKAFQTLATNKVFAEVHFNVNGNEHPLVNSDGSLALQGKALVAALGSGTPPPTQGSTPTPAGGKPTPTPTGTPKSTSTPGATPTPTPIPQASPTPGSSLTPTPVLFPTPTPVPVGANPTPTPTPVPAPPPSSSLHYSFEDGGNDGWTRAGNVSSLTNSTAVGGQDGQHALKAVLSSRNASDLPYVSIATGGPRAGQTLTAYVYVPAGTPATVNAKLFVQDSNFVWHSTNLVPVSSGGWFKLSYTIPAINGSVTQFGIQFYCSPNNVSSTVYIDSIGWS